MWYFVFVVCSFTHMALVVRCELSGPITPSNRFTESEIDRITDIYYQFCTSSEKCDGNFHVPEVRIQIPNITICCNRACSCEASTCQLSRIENCCPELLNEITPLMPDENIKCIHPQLKPWNPKLLTTNPTFEAFFMTSKCGVDQRESVGAEIADKCEFSYRYNELETRVPVTIKGQPQSYLNVYCALCHDLQTVDLVAWTPVIHYSMNTFEIFSFENIVEQLLQSEHCTLHFVPPEGITSYLPSCGSLISECNITGRWKMYDSVIEAGCAAFFVPFQNIYRNVFCYLCNSDGSLSDMQQCSPLNMISNNSYSYVLKYPINDESANGNDVTTCEPNGVMDPFQDICLNVTCLLQKVYVGGKRCERIVEKMGGQDFKVFLKFTPQTELRRGFRTFDMFVPKISVYTRNILNEASLNDFVANFGTAYKENSNIIVYFLSFFSIHLPQAVSPSQMVNITSLYHILNYHKHNTLLGEEYMNASFILEFDTEDSILDSKLSHFAAGEPPQTNDNFETLLPTHKCPTVELDFSFYNLINGSLLVILNDSINITLNRNEYIMGKNEDSFIICLDAYETLVGTIYEKPSSNANLQNVTILLLLLSLVLHVLK